MDRNQAKDLIITTFENKFDEKNFFKFIANLLKEADFNKRFDYHGNYIPEAYRNYIQRYKRIGVYENNDERIDILIVYLNKETSLERARSMQRNFIAGYLAGKYGSDAMKDAALVAFVSPDSLEWRFSLVKMEYRFEETERGKTRVREEFTPAKRWSFLVGVDEKSHTAQSRFLPILEDDNYSPTLDALTEAFNVETVTEEFFTKYRDLFIRTKKELDKILEKDNRVKEDFSQKGIDVVNFAKNLLGQIVFLYFLQKKGWFGVKKGGKWGTGAKNFLRELFEKRDCNYKNFFNDILESLFYDALRIDRTADDHYYSRFNCKIPFLNGGLFDPVGGYDWENIDINIPNELFSNKNKTKEGDIGDGILDIFDRYNFTVKEDEPLEKEVAVDPELLGKAYERFNAIRTDNYDEYKKILRSGNKQEESKFNKQYGVYYTPREIVHYMCNEALKNVLKNSYSAIDSIFNNESKTNFSITELQSIKKEILNLKLCDPACGSGAFLVGMMSEMVNIITKIDNLLRDKSREEIKNKKRENNDEIIVIKENDKIIYNPDDELKVEATYLGKLRFKIVINGEEKWELLANDMALYIKSYINQFNKKRGKNTIANIFSQGRINNDPSFNTLRGHKRIRYIVDENNNIIWMYKDYETEGRTRSWKNETTESENEENILINEDNYSQYVQDLKKEIIQNSIYGVDIDSGAVEISKLRLWLSLVVEFEGEEIKPLPNLDYKIVCGNSLMSVEKDLFNSKSFEELEKLKPLFFNETNPTKKQEYKKQIDECISKITEGHKEFDFEVYFSEVFHHKASPEQSRRACPEQSRRGGFDIVIGNPPYIQLQKNQGELANLYKDKGFETFDRMGDIYCLFYEKGLQILKPGGYLCFITSNKWMRAGYGEKIRNFFLNYNPVILIDLGPGIFESATVDTNILLVQKTQNLHQLKAVTIQRQNNETVDIEAQLNTRGVQLTKLTKDAWFIGSSAEQKLKEKIESIGKPLKDWDVKIYRGILTGLNEAFIITTEKRNEILANCKDDASAGSASERKRTEAIIKPILRGRDIKRYYYEWAGLWVIVIPAGWTDENRGKIPPEKFILEQFHSLMNHLKPFEEKAKKRDDQGDYWWELRHCTYYPEFEREKVVWGNISYDSEFCFVESGIYINAPANIITSNKTSIKYLIAQMNSKIFDWQFKQVGIFLGHAYEWKKQYVEQVRIPPITPANQSIVKQIEALVDKILFAKKADPQADTSNWEKEIDRLVYKLYDLTEEEIKIVERGGEDKKDGY